MLVLLIVITGLMAGIYFAFSAFVMKALNELPPSLGARAMNKINDVIVNTVFLPMFFVSTLWYAGLLVWAITDWQEGYSVIAIAAAVIYIGGMFGVTAFGNVPLNNRLKSYDGHEKNLVEYWPIYLGSWTKLNHVRTFSCIAATALLTQILG